jgi:hypothetical protein
MLCISRAKIKAYYIYYPQLKIKYHKNSDIFKRDDYGSFMDFKTRNSKKQQIIIKLNKLGYVSK